MAEVSLADLLKVPAPDLQRGLTKVPNRLLAIAIAAASPDAARELLAHVSSRRRSEVEAERLAIGKVPHATAQAAVKNVLKKVLGLKGEEVDAAEDSVTLGPPPPRKKKKPSAPLTAEDFRAYLLHLRSRSPLMKSVVDRQAAEAIRILMRRLFSPPEEPRKE